MASTLKDARWQLSFEITKGINLEWSSLNYDQQTRLLEFSQSLLNTMDKTKIHEYADKWNNNRSKYW